MVERGALADADEATSIDAKDAISAGPAALPVEEMGGDPACWIHLFCPDCGVQLEASDHLPSCQAPSFNGAQT
jgi:hypothetical protein